MIPPQYKLNPFKLQIWFGKYKNVFYEIDKKCILDKIHYAAMISFKRRFSNQKLISIQTWRLSFFLLGSWY